MYQTREEFQKGKQYGKTEEGRESVTTENDEDDLRIMQHFVRDHIDRPR